MLCLLQTCVEIQSFSLDEAVQVTSLAFTILSMWGRKGGLQYFDLIGVMTGPFF
jgi:hypothetical protein